MAYDELLAKRIREMISFLPNVEEKKMMGGLTFMYHDKMCVGIMKDELMCRIDPEQVNEVLKRNGCRQMELGKRLLKGYVLVNESGMKSNEDLEFWINLALVFNKKAKSSKQK